jgi:uncharacterized protein
MKKLLVLLILFIGVTNAQYDTNERSLFVIRQTNWVTCGPAALATVLDKFAEIPTTEKEIIDLATRFMPVRMNTSGEQEGGFSALSLKKAAEIKLMSVKGFRFDTLQVTKYFDDGGLPLIAHVQKPQAHFVVLIAKIKNYLVIGDPTWGRKIMSLSDFTNEKDFSGAVLLFFPKVAVHYRMQTNQAINIEWAKIKLAKLGIR